MPRDSYSIQLPPDWEKNYDDGGSLVAFSSPSNYATVLVSSHFAEFGWKEGHNIDSHVSFFLSLNEDEPSYRTVAIWPVSTTTKRSSYAYDGQDGNCDIEGHGLHILTENYSYFVQVEVCTNATTKFDATFVESIFASFSYQE